MACNSTLSTTINLDSVVFLGPKATFARYFRCKVRFEMMDGRTYELDTYGYNAEPNFCYIEINGNLMKLEQKNPAVGID